MLLLLDFTDEVPTATGDELCPPSRAEVDEMQVKLGPRDEDEWHRPIVNARSTYDATTSHSRTACDLAILGAYNTRDPSYAGKLCKRGCFTPLELKLNAELLAAAVEQKRLENLQWFGRTKSQRARVQKERAQEAFEEVRRINTERMRKLLPDGTPAPDDEEDKDKP